MTATQINTLDLIVTKMAHGKTLSAAMKDIYTKRNVVIPYEDEWLDCKLVSLKMSMRTTNALLRNKFETIGDVVEFAATRDEVDFTPINKISSLPTFGRKSGIELFEAILDYCWKQMPQETKDRFIIDVVIRNSENLRAEIVL
jgi:hypothetical protein